MNDYEILRVIDFIERTREPFAKLMPVSDEEPIWKVIACLIKSEIKGQIVTASTLAHVSGAPFSTSRRLIARLIARGHIVRKPRSRTGKTFSLHPSAEITRAFMKYAAQIKGLLAETMGARSAVEDEQEYYLGGTSAASSTTPPFGLVQNDIPKTSNFASSYPTTTIFRPCAICGWISATIWRHGGISIICRCRICITAPSRTAPNGFRTMMS